MRFPRLVLVLVSALSLLLGGPGLPARAASASAVAAAEVAAKDTASAEAPCPHEAQPVDAGAPAADDDCCGGLVALTHCASSCPSAGVAVPFDIAVVAPAPCAGLVPRLDAPLPRGRTVAPEPPPPTR